MKFNFIILVLSIFVLITTNQLLVVGKASRALKTSISVLKFEIVGSDKDPVKSINKVQATFDKLKKALKGDVNKQNIKSTPMQIEMQATNQGKISFYEAIIEVQIFTSKNIGDIISKADKFGTLIDVSYRSSEQQKQKIRLKLVQQAFDQAQRKAKKYAQSIGVELEGIQLIEIHDEPQKDNNDFELSVKVEILYQLSDPNENKLDQTDTTQFLEIKNEQLLAEDETKYEESNQNKDNESNQQKNEKHDNQNEDEQQNQKQQDKQQKEEEQQQQTQKEIRKRKNAKK